MDNDAQEALPAGWSKSSIGEITLAVQKIDPLDNPQREIDYIDISSIDNVRNVVGVVKRFRLKDAPSRARQIIRTGDVLFATVRPYLRNIAAVPETYDGHIASTGFSVLRPASGIAPAFLFYKGISADFVNALSVEQYGVSYPAVSDDQVREQVVLVPPYNEQCRIVAKIDELFSKLDSAVENLQLAQRQLTIYRQCVLDAAFKKLSAVKGLNSLLAEKMSNGYSGKPVKYATKNKVLSLSSTTSGTFKPECFKYLDEKGLKDRDVWCAPNDILVQRGNTIEYVGVPAIYTGAPNEFIFPDLMIRLRHDPTLVDPKYLYYALSSPRIRNFLRTKARGSAGSMPKISQSILSSVEIPYCPLAEQKEIVKHLEEQASIIDQMVEDNDLQIKRGNILRHSILKKALAGQLVQQDNNDEPASKLLERIKFEKAAGENGRKKNGRRQAA